MEGIDARQRFPACAKDADSAIPVHVDQGHVHHMKM